MTLMLRTPDDRTANEDAYCHAAAELIDNWLRSAPGTPAPPVRLSRRCPECGFEDNENGLHAQFDGLIIVGCEGYWVINPNLLGFDRPLWTNDAGEPE